MTSVKPTISTATPAITKIVLAFTGMRRITAATTMTHPASSQEKTRKLHGCPFCLGKVARTSASAISHNLIVSAIRV